MFLWSNVILTIKTDIMLKYDETTYEAIISWNKCNYNKVGLKDPSDVDELKRLVELEGLDVFEFISEYDIAPYKKRINKPSPNA